jgi:CarD family transcriptional regulator
MKGGSLLEIAEVFKGLIIIQTEKPLSFREKKMLERSRSMLVLETSVAKSVAEAEAMNLIGRRWQVRFAPSRGALSLSRALEPFPVRREWLY